MNINQLLTQTLNKDEIDENKFDSLKQYLKPIQTNDKIVPKGSFKQFEYDEDIMIPHYLEQIVNGVQENSDEIDQLIDHNSKYKDNKICSDYLYCIPRTSFKNTAVCLLFGTSIPTAAFPGIGASILIPEAANPRAISSLKLTILLTLTPGLG